CVLHPLTPAPCLSPFSCSPDPRHLPSFPTRRSSDLPSDVWASLAHTSPVRDRHPGDGRGGMTAWAGQARPCAMSEAIVPDSQHRSEEHTSELQSRENLVCRLLLEKKKKGCRQRDYGE